MLRYTVVLTPQLLSIHQLISMHAVAHTTQLHGAGGNPDKESQLSLLWHSCMICSFVAQVRLNSGWGSCNVVHRLEILLFWCGGGSLLSIHHRSVLPSVWRCTRVTGILDSFSCDLQASEPIALSVPERDFIFLASWLFLQKTELWKTSYCKVCKWWTSSGATGTSATCWAYLQGLIKPICKAWSHTFHTIKCVGDPKLPQTQGFEPVVAIFQHQTTRTFPVAMHLFVF